MGVAFLLKDKPRKLHETICLWKNKPVYVMCIGYKMKPNYGVKEVRLEPNEVNIFPLERGQNEPYEGGEIVDYTSDDFDYRAFPLGYVNHKGEAHYLARAAVRGASQGLNAHAIEGLGGSLRTRSKAFEDMVVGNYLSYELAFKIVADGEVKSAAFDRHFALHSNLRDLHLEYRGRKVGKYREEGHFEIDSSPEKSLIEILARPLGVPV